MGEERLTRTSAGPLRLLLAAIGGPRQLAGKVRRLARTVRIYLDPREVPRRLDSLVAQNVVEQRPSRRQLLFGGFDMLRFVIEPAAREYYESKGINFGFHQLLRILDDPVSMIDPTGFYSDRDTIIGHLMQVVHLNPVYDLQILQMFPNGVGALEDQVLAMVEGRHPRQGTIGAIVEDPDYHRRLLAYVRDFRVDPGAEPPRRAQSALRDDPAYVAAEECFATLPGFIGYAASLPNGFAALLRRYRQVRKFPRQSAPP